MRILHTGDWHLGAYLEKHSRLPEQAAMIDALTEMADKLAVDMILIAGDIYDTQNPPAAAETLFYGGIRKLSAGKRPLLIIAGNHDSPDRLSAPANILYQCGAIVLGLPGSVALPGDYGFYRITTSEPGIVTIQIGNETAVVLTMPFPSEKRLNEVLTDQVGEQAMQTSFNDKIQAIFAQNIRHYREDTVNLAIGHFHIIGGQANPSPAERDIQYGGSFAVNSHSLPSEAQYIAMGHLHRPQKIAGLSNGFYSGSPMAYGFGETGYEKSVYIVDVQPGREASVTKECLPQIKPIEKWEAQSIEEALALCETNRDKPCWVYLWINSDRPMLRSESKALLAFKPDIVKIILQIGGDTQEMQTEAIEERSVTEEFTDFYHQECNTTPDAEILALFMEIMRNEEDGPTLDAVEEAFL